MFGTTVAGDLPGPEWLRALRIDAAERLADASLPTTDEEVWRYSRINELDLELYAPVAAGSSGDVPDSVARLVESLPPYAGLVVLRDGFVVQSELDPSWAAKGVWVGPLATAPDAEQALGSVIDTPGDVFGRMNLAYSPDPLLVRVPAGLAVDRPIIVVDWVGAEGVAVFPHTVVQLGPASEATVVEWQTGSDLSALVAPIAELDVADEARLTHVTIQQRGRATWQIAEQAARVAKQATFTGHQIGLGGDYARSRVDCRLTGRGATGNLRAAYFGEREQMLDFRTFQDHLAPDTTSDLLFKGAVAGTSRSVYTGLIHVAKEARGTNAFQTNRNVKLSEGAWAESVPNLEIENNDVRCSHASTVGPIDEDQRFYLESRGVPPDVAERLIVAGFFNEVLEQIPIPELAGQLEAEIDRRLAPGGRVMALERLCSVKDLEPGESKRFDLGKLRIALVRIGDDWYAIGDRCTHQDVSLAEGEVNADDLEIECWKHGSSFSLVTGAPNSLPATKPEPVFAVKIDDGDVYVEVP